MELMDMKTPCANDILARDNSASADRGLSSEAAEDVWFAVGKLMVNALRRRSLDIPEGGYGETWNKVDGLKLA
jgi:hypothetical protein